ncbi:MAG: TetR/AcrR family transcriptional regulator [Acidimicrobiales bacterium]|jgi:AcrR family transcriptional regulator
MAKPGSTSQLGERSGPAGAATRSALTAAAVRALQEEGFAGASARAIARNAGCNQALVFYHFGSVVNLLLSALDETSRRRMERYTEAAESAAGVRELVDVAAEIFRQDLDDGHLSVLAEMIAGSSSVPGLGPEVADRIAPWMSFAEGAVSRALEGSPMAAMVPVADIAYAVVALYLGVEMLAHLDGDRSRAEALFASAKQLAGLAALAGLVTSDEVASPHTGRNL